MDRLETVKLFGIIKSAYENFCFNLSKDELALKIDTWSNQLKNIKYVDAVSAIEKHIKFESRIPVIADIINFTLKDNKIAGNTAFSIYLKYINLYSTYEDYERLKNDYPDIYEIAKLIGNRTLLLGEEGYVKSNFVRVFEAYQTEKIQNSISDTLRLEIGKMQSDVSKHLIREGRYGNEWKPIDGNIE